MADILSQNSISSINTGFKSILSSILIPAIPVAIIFLTESITSFKLFPYPASISTVTGTCTPFIIPVIVSIISDNCITWLSGYPKEAAIPILVVAIAL